MSDEQYRALLDLMMCSDPWPVTGDDTENQVLVTELANTEAVKRGYENWVDAYHEHNKRGLNDAN